MNEPENEEIRQQDAEIRRYWLGQLSQDGEKHLEDLYFADDAVFEHVKAIQEELIDDYLFGRLNREERQCFDQHFLQSQDHREHVEVIESLIEKLKKTPQVVPTPFWKLWTGWPTPAKTLAGAFAALFFFAALSAAWLVKENRQIRQERDQMLTEKQAREAELARVTAELKRKEAALLALSPSPTPSITPQPQSGATPKVLPPVTDQSAFVALATLAPDMEGRGSSYSTEVKIAPDDQRLKLRLKVNDATAYRLYKVEVKADGGRHVQNQSGLRPVNNDTIEVPFAARLFAAGKYDLTLYGERGKNAPALLFSYSFRVARE